MPAQPNADAGAGRAGRDDRAPPQPAASPVDGEAFADTAAQLRSPSDAPPPHAPLDEAASGAAGPAAMPGAAAAGAGAAVAGEGPEHGDGQVGHLGHLPLEREVLGADRRLDQAGHVAVQHCAVPTSLDELGKGVEDLEGAGLEAERATTAARGGRGPAPAEHDLRRRLAAAVDAADAEALGKVLRKLEDLRVEAPSLLKDAVAEAFEAARQSGNVAVMELLIGAGAEAAPAGRSASAEDFDKPVVDVHRAVDEETYDAGEEADSEAGVGSE